MTLLMFLGLGLMMVGALSILIPLRFLGIRTRPRGLLTAVIGVGLVTFAGANLPAEQQAPSSAVGIASGSWPAAQPSANDRAASAMPDLQKRFLGAVDTGRHAFSVGANEMQKGAARPARAQLICSVMPAMKTAAWVGQVESLSSNNEGKGVLSVKIAPKTFIKTWNNGVSDIGTGSLIEPGSPLFKSASALARGQWVTFSGSFVRDQVDCVREASLTLQGSVTEPEFIFKFSEIAPF